MKIKPTELAELMEACLRRHETEVQKWRLANTTREQMEEIERLRFQRTQLEVEVERLRLELEHVKASAQLMGMDVTEQMKLDAALGRLVRQMPENYSILHREVWAEIAAVSSPWMVRIDQVNADPIRVWGETPEEALRTAGVGTDTAVRGA